MIHLSPSAGAPIFSSPLMGEGRVGVRKGVRKKSKEYFE
jgi:hypothetical protein